MKISAKLLEVIVCLFMFVPISGCGKKHSSVWEQQQKLLQEEDKLYAAYLVADVNHARQILERKLQLLEGDVELERNGWAHAHFMDYSRLYVLEKHIGNEDGAEADLIKARYWFLQSGELGKMPIGQVMEEVRKFDANRIFEMVDNQDSSATGGKGPNYLKDLRASGSAGKQ